MLLKIGILLEWARIFAPQASRNTFWWLCHITMAVNIVFYTIIAFIQIFGCSPREKLWNVTLPGKCIDTAEANLVAAIVNFISDAIILLLPHKVIWGLHLTTRKKFGIAGLFFVGILYVSNPSTYIPS